MSPESALLLCGGAEIDELSLLNVLRMPIARSWISLLIVMVCAQMGVNDPTHFDDEGFSAAGIHRVGRSFRYFSVYHQKTSKRNRLGTFLEPVLTPVHAAILP